MLSSIRSRIIATGKLFAATAICLSLGMTAVAQIETDLEPPAPPTLEVQTATPNTNLDVGAVVPPLQAVAPPTLRQVSAGNASATRLLRSRSSGTINSGPTIRTASLLQPSPIPQPDLEEWGGPSVVSTKTQLKAAATRSAQAQAVNGSNAPMNEQPNEPIIAQVAYENVEASSAFAKPITSLIASAEPNHLSIPSAQHIPTVDVHSYYSPATLSQPIATASYCDSAPCSCDSCSGGYVSTGCDGCGSGACSGSCGGGGLLGGCGGIFGACLAAEGFYAAPLGSSVDGYLDAQIYGAQSARSFLYRYDFLDRGDTSQLKEAGRTKLRRLAKSGWNGQAIGLEPVPGRPNLSAARKAAVEQFLQSEGISYSQVILTHPDYEGLRGVEAAEIDRNQLQNTRSFGALGGGAGANNQFGTSINGGQTQQGQQLRR